MRIAQRLGLAAVLLAIVLGLASLGAFASIDELLADLRLSLLGPPSSEVAPSTLPGQWPGMAAAILFALIWVFVAARIPMRQAIASALGAIAGAIVLSFPLQALFGVTLSLGGFVLAMLVLLGFHITLGFAAEFARRRRAEAQLVYLARHDPVTGLPSRLGLLEQLEAGPPTPILVIALQRLELVRGTLGRDVADETLRQAAQRFGGLGSHRLSVIGNDTFAVTTNEDLDVIGRELRRSLRTAFKVDGHEVHVDALLAAALPDPAVPPALQLQRAELALQAALDNPAATVLRFAPAMEEVVARRRRIDTALRQAIDRRELTVVFQPQARVDSDELVGVEALVRWTSTEFGPISPAEFIPLAEETGLIVPLGRFVLGEACRTAAAWPWQGRLAVNVSAAQLAQSDVAQMVADGLGETGFDPARLDIEITESVLVDGPEPIVDTFARLKALGVGIALDDFGTGYSSLSYLSRLSFDKLKLDQSFVRRLGESEAGDAIVRTVIELAQRLGKTTVAEGVETEAQRATLAAMGCDLCQGWLIGKPVRGAEIAERIATTRAA